MAVMAGRVTIDINYGDAAWEERKHPRKRGKFAKKGEEQPGQGRQPGQGQQPAPRQGQGQEPKQGRVGVQASGIHAAEALKAQWSSQSKFRTAQDVIAAASGDQDKLAKAATAIGRLTGAEVSNPGVKSPERIAEKLSRPGRTPQKITDVVRLGFKVSSPAQADKIVKELGSRFEVADEGWAVTKAGYFDRKLILRMPGGSLGEVQLWEPTVLEIKEHRGHALYTQMQKLPQNDPRHAQLEEQSRQLYGAVRSRLGPTWKALLGNLGS